MSGKRGRSGRKKLPAGVKKLRGTDRADRDSEPASFGASTIPSPSEHLRDDVAAEWIRLAALLSKKGLFTDIDWLAWELGFSAYNTWKVTCEELISGDYVVYSDKGAPYQNPLVSVNKQAYSAVMQFCREFGLTPSARSGLRIDDGKPEETDPLDELLGS